MTRDQLLASVHELRPGDLLVLRLPSPTVTMQEVQRAQQIVDERLQGSGVRVLVVSRDIEVKHYRRVESDEDFVAEVERELRKRERARGGRT